MKPRIHMAVPQPNHPWVEQHKLPVHRVLCGQRGGPLGVMTMRTWQHVTCKRCLRYMGP